MVYSKTMKQQTSIKTTIGKVRAGQGTTPSSGATASIEEIGKKFREVAESEIINPIDIEKLDRNEPEETTSKK